MDLSPFFKSIIDTDRAQIVICDLDNTIVYMNPAAVKRYEKRGGANLIGRNLIDCHNPHSRELIKRTIEWFGEDAKNNIVFESHNEKDNRDVYTVAIRDKNGKLIGYYEKHEYRTPETSKPFDFENVIS